VNRKTIEQRFWEKVDKTSSCWNWTAYKNKDGYGRFGVKSSSPIAAHRFSYELHKGKIPKGLTIDHLCRNRKCVNPDHLEIVTQRENTLRGNGVGVINARKTHCKRGHEYTPENTLIRNDNGGRRCRICIQEKIKQARLKKIKRKYFLLRFL